MASTSQCAAGNLDTSCSVAVSVSAVIVSYNPGCPISSSISALRSQVRDLVIVDNGSHSKALQELRTQQRSQKFSLLENGTNLGVPAALNIGIRELAPRGDEWIALFDQDSLVSPVFVKSMLLSYIESPDPSRIAILCPRYIDPLSGRNIPISRSSTGDVLTAMTSGSLIRADLFKDIGYLTEALFIDYADVEFCLRARRAGYKIMQCPDAVLQHHQGNVSWHKVLGRHLATTNHSAARRYYITRNRLWVLARFSRDWPWFSREIKALCTETIKLFVFESDRLNKLKGIIAGIVDAFAGRLGERLDLGF